MGRFKKFQEKLSGYRQRRLAGYFSVGKPESTKILVVDDEKIHQLTLSAHLRHLGYIPDIANNGWEAIAMFSSTKYDLVFMDVEMPVLDGIEATRKIMANNHPQPVIIGYTTLNTANSVELCGKAGMSTVISKPAKKDIIQTIMEDFSKHSTVTKR